MQVQLRRHRRKRLGAAIALIVAAFSPEAFAATAEERAVFAGRVAFEGVSVDARQQQFIVRYREGTAKSGNAAQLSQDLGRVAREVPGADLMHVRTLATGAELIGLVHEPREPNARQAESVMMALARNPAVEMVEVDVLLYPSFVPNDPQYNQQWHYLDATGGIRLPGAWDLATGSGITVAVIDTGITSHPDLNANVVPGYDFISDVGSANDGNGRDPDASDPGNWIVTANPPPPGGSCTEGVCTDPDSIGTKGLIYSTWHGTHVAGTVAAQTNNSTGVAGVAFHASIAPVRVFGQGTGRLSDIAEAIYWSAGGSVEGVPASLSAQVINMSFGGPGSGPNNTCSPELQTAISYAFAQGRVLVAAAGNQAGDVALRHPANCNGVIAVAATNRQGLRSTYSNTGANIDVAAPGDAVLSTSNAGTQSPGAATYATKQGTSMAAPHVAGLAALILSRGPRSPADVEALIKQNARPIAGCSGCGSGLIDAQRTLQSMPSGPPPIAPDAFEEDDTRLAYKALFEGIPHTHNFSESLDQDWVAFAVSEGIRSTVRLNGPVAANATMKLYRQFNYPNGNVELVQTVSNQAGQLQVANDAPFGAGQAVYYVLATPSAPNIFGAGTEYTLAVTTEELPDTFEPDNQFEAYKALFEGIPHTHTFHQTNDQDWVAYAISAGITGRVTLQGNVASATRMEMYRDSNYPNTPPILQLVSSTGAPVNGTLTVQHTAPANGNISVYYVRVAANGGNATGRDSYSISVSTQ